MFTNISGYIFVVCLTFSSVVLQSDNQHGIIVDDMKETFQNCSSSPLKIYSLANSVDMVECGARKPDLNKGRECRVFSFNDYLCMELFDLSLQLCRLNSTLEISQIIDNITPDVSGFCSKLKFDETRANKTREWADATITCLSNISYCELICKNQNILHPLCKAIYMSNHLLTVLNANNDKKPVIPVSSDQKVMPTHSSHEQNVQTETKAGNSTNFNDVLTSQAGSTTITAEIGSVLLSSGKSETKNVTLAPRLTNNQGPRREDSTNSIITKSRGVEKSFSLTDSPLLDSTKSSFGVNAGTDALNKEVGNEQDDANVDMDVSGYGKNTPDNDSGNVSPKENGDDHMENILSGDTDDTSTSTGNSFNGPQESKVSHDTFVDAQDSHFFAYFLTMIVLCIVGYLVFHNKQKIIALALEGRRMQGSRRRPSTSSYKKLDSNLEEAVTSTCSSSSVTHVIF